MSIDDSPQAPESAPESDGKPLDGSEHVQGSADASQGTLDGLAAILGYTVESGDDLARFLCGPPKLSVLSSFPKLSTRNKPVNSIDSVQNIDISAELKSRLIGHMAVKAAEALIGDKPDAGTARTALAILDSLVGNSEASRLVASKMIELQTTWAGNVQPRNA